MKLGTSSRDAWMDFEEKLVECSELFGVQSQGKG